jgi:hypothetical protein
MNKTFRIIVLLVLSVGYDLAVCPIYDMWEHILPASLFVTITTPWFARWIRAVVLVLMSIRWYHYSISYFFWGGRVDDCTGDDHTIAFAAYQASLLAGHKTDRPSSPDSVFTVGSGVEDTSSEESDEAANPTYRLRSRSTKIPTVTPVRPSLPRKSTKVKKRYVDSIADAELKSGEDAEKAESLKRNGVEDDLEKRERRRGEEFTMSWVFAFAACVLPQKPSFRCDSASFHVELYVGMFFFSVVFTCANEMMVGHFFREFMRQRRSYVPTISGHLAKDNKSITMRGFLMAVGVLLAFGCSYLVVLFRSFYEDAVLPQGYAVADHDTGSMWPVLELNFTITPMYKYSDVFPSAIQPRRIDLMGLCCHPLTWLTVAILGGLVTLFVDTKTHDKGQASVHLVGVSIFVFACIMLAANDGYFLWARCVAVINMLPYALTFNRACGYCKEHQKDKTSKKGEDRRLLLDERARTSYFAEWKLIFRTFEIIALVGFILPIPITPIEYVICSAAVPVLCASAYFVPNFIANLLRNYRD